MQPDYKDFFKKTDYGDLFKQFEQSEYFDNFMNRTEKLDDSVNGLQGATRSNKGNNEETIYTYDSETINSEEPLNLSEDDVISRASNIYDTNKSLKQISKYYDNLFDFAKNFTSPLENNNCLNDIVGNDEDDSDIDTIDMSLTNDINYIDNEINSKDNEMDSIEDKLEEIISSLVRQNDFNNLEKSYLELSESLTSILGTYRKNKSKKKEEIIMITSIIEDIQNNISDNELVQKLNELIDYINKDVLDKESLDYYTELLKNIKEKPEKEMIYNLNYYVLEIKNLIQDNLKDNMEKEIII